MQYEIELMYTIGTNAIKFLIFINDLLDNIRSSVRLFADDCVLYMNIYSIQDCLTLQEDLTSLGQWEADWQMNSMWPNVTR